MDARTASLAAAAAVGGMTVVAVRRMSATLPPPPEVNLGQRSADDITLNTSGRAALVDSLQAGLATLLDFVHDEVRRIDAKQGFDTFAAGLVSVSVPPLVLVLGNHNSGKSTFINSLCQRQVQHTGAAPHDGFSLICRSAADETTKGPILVARRQSIGDFDELSRFGDAFLGHLELKRQRLSAGVALPEGVVIVDTPGMIDAPGQSPQRPYDFGGVVRWFARRAALTLLFFDGSNPGTTGETLGMWRSALNDPADRHKLMLVLGKSDRFNNVADFARTYGALCWNLAKVSDEKDAPPVETMFNDIAGIQQVEQAETANLPVSEFLEGREKVTKAVGSVLQTHVDNALTAADTAVSRLSVAAEVSHAAAGACRKALLWVTGFTTAAAAVPLVVAWIRSGGQTTSAPPAPVPPLVVADAEASKAEPVVYTALRWACALSMSVGCIATGRWEYRRRCKDIVSLRSLDEVYYTAYGRAATRMSFKQQWHHIRRVLAGLFATPEPDGTVQEAGEPRAVPARLSGADRARLKELTTDVLPRLRSIADALKGHRRQQMQ
eukprot:TRINITY_DN43691_c0_g1_i1.p1 TRINITY_DN43691_c0_g1~~TRINITY_DN43691_c0_g1_i1.p1  ORF type:complete len:552 (+),score=148.67 TRINITY_DN43691_c0_g1_i1:51-1706(+)